MIHRRVRICNGCNLKLKEFSYSHFQNSHTWRLGGYGGNQTAQNLYRGCNLRTKGRWNDKLTLSRRAPKRVPMDPVGFFLIRGAKGFANNLYVVASERSGGAAGSGETTVSLTADGAWVWPACLA